MAVKSIKAQKIVDQGHVSVASVGKDPQLESPAKSLLRDGSTPVTIPAPFK